jgi:hypothetical protein
MHTGRMIMIAIMYIVLNPTCYFFSLVLGRTPEKSTHCPEGKVSFIIGLFQLPRGDMP